MEGLWETDLKGLTIGEVEDFNKIKKELFNKLKEVKT